MSASNNFITRPVLSTVCSLLIVIVGLIAIPILPIENLPDIAPPTVKVQATYVGADAVSVEQGVTSVLEQQINGVEEMDYITSNSSADGVSSIRVSFNSGTDANINQVNVQNRVALAEPQLPEEVRKEIQPWGSGAHDPSVVPKLGPYRNFPLYGTGTQQTMTKEQANLLGSLTRWTIQTNAELLTAALQTANP